MEIKSISNFRIRNILQIISVLILTGCIKEQAANSECDIEQCIFHFEDPTSIFYNIADTLIIIPSDRTNIFIKVRPDANLSNISPEFKLSDGAKIWPESGSEQDFSNGGVEYIVTSEDDIWSRTYTIHFQTITNISTIQNFEYYTINSKLGNYYYWFDQSECDTNGIMLFNNANIWASGNPGFKLSNPSARAIDYPTSPYENGYKGNAVKLTTRSTGVFGAMVNMRLAAGNLFIGDFDAKYALVDVMKATSFGRPFSKKPERVIGYYQYSSGETYIDRYGKIVDNMIDTPDIYAVLYKNIDDKGNSILLHGDNILSSPYIVAVARISNLMETNTWTRFDIEFDYDSYAMDLDYDLLKDFGYNITIVFSSSSGGGDFRGAIGSILLVDELELICSDEY